VAGISQATVKGGQSKEDEKVVQRSQGWREERNGGAADRQSVDNDGQTQRREFMIYTSYLQPLATMCY